MDNIKRILSESKNLDSFVKRYLEYVSKLLKLIDSQSISLFVDQLEEARENKNTIFIIGNGGSAATASHMANDLALGSRSADKKDSYRVLSLTDNITNITALSNDCGYERVFVDQLKVHYRPGDKLVVISASGNSPNVVNAAEWVKKQGGVVIGLLGFNGGKLKDLCDISIHIVTPEGEYGPVEDAHMVVDHLVYTWLYYKKRESRDK